MTSYNMSRLTSPLGHSSNFGCIHNSEAYSAKKLCRALRASDKVCKGAFARAFPRRFKKLAGFREIQAQVASIVLLFSSSQKNYPGLRVKSGIRSSSNQRHDCVWNQLGGL